MLSVLIVEDETILADMMEDLLTEGGYSVCGKARTVADAVMLANLHRPDLAVLDYRIADSDYSSRIPPLLKNRSEIGILYASGHKLDAILTRADGEAYIRKPYLTSDLLTALHLVHELRTTGSLTLIDLPKNFHALAKVALNEPVPV